MKSSQNPPQYSHLELVALAEETMADAKFPCLATVDEGGWPRVRPVSPVKTDGFTIYIANLRSYGKTAEIAAEPRVELCYLSKSHDQVRISGCAEVVGDKSVMLEIWEANPLLRKYLGSPDNPELIIYRVVPERVRFMKEWALEYYDVPVVPRSS
ncbi:MAG: pyridoxamine 5'-phosphate oxidase family protein [Verrucomicrobiae bacterium]|nr:pyridoxamine 5'-phosphate oxidase family protein [Verrucomicrobiae bacterium]